MSEIKISETGMSYGIPCGVCGEFVPITQSEIGYTVFKLCDECIKAIKFAKTLMKNNPNMNIDGDDKK